MPYQDNRDFMKSEFAQSVHQVSDQAKKVPYPPLQKPLPEGETVLIDLPDPAGIVLVEPDLAQLLRKRQSWRKFTKEPLSALELSFLLFATQG
ncbi:MAG: nitroreductase, partial [Anaerolineales bacterium]